jgi:hypothetical protein
LHGDPAVSGKLWERLREALDSLQETVQKIEQPPPDEDDDRPLRDDQQSRKRRKRAITIRTIHDPYHIWISAWKDCPGDGPSRVLEEDFEDIPEGAGGKFTQLSLGGLINALAGVTGGVTHQATPLSAGSVKTLASVGGAQDSVAVDAAIVYEAASKLHRACATRIQADVLRTTPLRIHVSKIKQAPVIKLSLPSPHPPTQQTSLVSTRKRNAHGPALHWEGAAVAMACYRPTNADAESAGRSTHRFVSFLLPVRPLH